MQAYDLVTRRSTAPCRIVGIAAPLSERPSPLSSASTKIKPGKPAPAMGPGTSSVSFDKTRTPPECASKGGVSGILITGFGATAGGPPLEKHIGERRPINVANSPI